MSLSGQTLSAKGVGGDTFGSWVGSAGNFGVNFVELSGLAYGVSNCMS